MLPKKITFLGSIILLQSLSLVTIWSTAESLFLTQLSFVVAGALLILFLSKIDLTFLFSLSNLWYFGSIFLLLLTFLVGKNIRGSVRWIDLGLFNLQTSEIVKPMLALFYVDYLCKYSLKGYKDILKFLGIALVPVFLIAKQPDLGSALTLLFLPLILLIFKGHFAKLFILGLLSLLVLVPLELKFLKPYQRQRLETFINPYRDPRGSGYNVIQSTIAVGSGGFLGKGVRLGTQSHLNFLPERHTDFIFASFVEEFGLLGSLVLVSGFLVYSQMALTVYRKSSEENGGLLALSVLGLVGFQTVVNIGMNIGLMPVTGITLPFFSYGGSSLLSFSILSGLLLRQLDLLPPLEI